MLTGDMSTMPLPDLLQWIEATGRSGTVTIQRATHTFTLQLESRHIVALSHPPHVPNPPYDPGAHLGWVELPLVDRCREALFDQFLDTRAPFRFEAQTDPRNSLAALVPVPDFRIQAAVMEAMRHADEWPGLCERFNDDQALLYRIEDVPHEPGNALQRSLLACAAHHVSLREASLRLGISLASTLRSLAPLQRDGLVELRGPQASLTSP